MARVAYDKFLTLTSSGATLPGATLQVKNTTPNTNLTQLYDSRVGGSLIPNPVTADVNGRVAFYLEPGRYTMQAVGSGGNITYQDVNISAEGDSLEFIKGTINSVERPDMNEYLDGKEQPDYTAFKSPLYNAGDIVDVAYRSSADKVLGSGGSFLVAVAADFATEIANDPNEGVFVGLANGMVGIRRRLTEANAKYFGWGGTSNRASLQAAIDYTTGVGYGDVAIDLSGSIDGTIQVKRGVLVRCAKGVEIECDYTSWTGLGLYSVPENTAFYIGTTGGSDVGQGATQGIDGLTLLGSNQSSLESVAVYCGCPDRRLVVGSAISVAARNISVSNINIARFDTALEFAEMWESSVSNIDIKYCRSNVKISGQTVNNAYSKITSSAGSRSFTSSVDKIYGIVLFSGINYGAGENVALRPEGNVFDSCLPIGCEIGIAAISCLATYFSKCVVDLHSEHAVTVGASPDTRIDKSYLSNGATALSTISVGSTVGTDMTLSITGCDLVSFDSSQGNMALDVGTFDGIEYSGNSHAGYSDPAQGIVCLFDNTSGAVIENNTFKSGIDSWTGQRCIEIRGGNNINVDGNISRNDNKILQLSTVSIPTNITIGSNKSVSQRTKEEGVITITNPATSGTVDFSQNNTGLGAPGETGISYIVTASCEQPAADLTLVANGVNTNRCTFTQAALGAPNKIYYATVAVPNSAA